jgi:hypothetical protein
LTKSNQIKLCGLRGSLRLCVKKRISRKGLDSTLALASQKAAEANPLRTLRKIALREILLVRYLINIWALRLKPPLPYGLRFARCFARFAPTGS